jgi:hypothetical protein
MGPMLCENVEKINVCKLSPAVIEGDALAIVLGEIDCRKEMPLRCGAGGQGLDPEVETDRIQACLFSHLNRQMDLLPPGVKLFVFNVLPPAHQNDLEDVIPCNGTDEERLSFNLLFNARLKANCRQSGYTFFDVYKAYEGEDGFLNAQYTTDGLHLSNDCFIADFMRRHGFGDCISGPVIPNDLWSEV